MRRVESGAIGDLDHPRAHDLDRVVVRRTRVGRHDDFVLEPLEIRQLDELVGIAAGDGRGRGEVSAADAPEVTMPHSAPVSCARRWLTPAISSSSCTYSRAAASIAAFTSGSVRLAPTIVTVPRALISGRTPTDS